MALVLPKCGFEITVAASSNVYTGQSVFSLPRIMRKDIKSTRRIPAAGEDINMCTAAFTGNHGNVRWN